MLNKNSLPQILIGFTLVISRISGVVREMVFLYCFGVTKEADVSVVVMTLPDLVFNVMASGGLNVSLMPVFINGRSRFNSVLFAALVLVVGAFVVLSVLLFAFCKYILIILIPGHSNTFEMIGLLNYMLICLSVPLTAFSGVCSIALTANGQVVAATSTNLIFNASIIFSLILGKHLDQAMTSLCLGIFGGCIIRVLVQMRSLRFVFPHDFGFKKEVSILFFHMVKSFPQGLSISSIVVSVPIIVRSLISNLGPGYLVAFNYSFKMVETLLSILNTIIETVTYRKLCEVSNQNIDVVFNIVKLTSSWALPLYVIISAFGCVTLNQIYDGVLLINSSDDSLSKVLRYLNICSSSAPFVFLNLLMTLILNSRGKSGVVLVCAVGSMLSMMMFGLCLWAMKKHEYITAMLPFFHVCMTVFLVWFNRFTVKQIFEHGIGINGIWLGVLLLLYALIDNAICRIAGVKSVGSSAISIRVVLSIIFYLSGFMVWRATGFLKHFSPQKQNGK